MLDRTNFFTAALFPAESGRRFQLAAWGNYPRSQAGMAFSFDRGWQNRRSASGSSYWYSSANKLSIAITSKQAFVAASVTNEPADPFAVPGAEIPQGFNSFRQGSQGLPGSPLSCWMANPGPAIARIMNNAGLPLRFPVQQLFINLYNMEEQQYEALIRFQFENASQARGMASILNLAGSFISDTRIAMLLANPPVHNGANLDIRTARLNERELSLLLQMFSLY